MEIRAATAEDRGAVETVVAAAFEEEADGRVVRLLRALDATGATRASIVAVAEDGQVVGHVQLSRSWVDARPALVEVFVLSPLSVEPDRQREGVGTALVRAALASAEDLGAVAVFLEGSWRYYGRRGFQAAGPLGFGRPSPRVPDPAFQVALLPAWQPWMVGPLVYCEAFWSTDTVGLRDPRLTEVEAAVTAATNTELAT
jgi:putative acetyltransferase